MVVGSLASLVSHTGCFQPGAGVFLALEQEGLRGGSNALRCSFYLLRIRFRLKFSSTLFCSLATSVMKPILTEESKRGLERGGGDGRSAEES